MYKSKFTLKIILLSIIPIIVFSFFSIVVLFYKIDELSHSASQITGNTLSNLYLQLLKDKSRDITEKVSLKLNIVFNELNIMRATSQRLIDKKKLHSFGKSLESNSWVKNKFVYNAEKNWSNLSKSDNNVTISVWGYLHDKNGTINQKTKDYITFMSPIKMLIQIIEEHGTDKGWIYVTGPKSTPVMIVSPWANLPKIFDQKYPGHNEKNWWDFFFPGIVEGWNEWLLKPDFDSQNVRDQVTLTPLYEDAGGTGLMITFFAPLWNYKRTENFGSVAIDYNVSNILELINNEKIGKTGYAFLILSNGDILGSTDDMTEVLELSQDKQTESGVDTFFINLRKSRIKELVNIAHKYHHENNFKIYQFTDSKGKNYFLSFKKILDYNQWKGNENLSRDSLYIGTLIPKDEIFDIQFQIHKKITSLSTNTISFLIAASTFFALLSVFLAGWYALKNTSQIRKMSQAIASIGNKNYDVSIDIIGRDDLGELATSFNHMIVEVRNAYHKLENYTNNLENEVKERTIHLEEANKAKSDFLANMSHEIRTPMNSIIGMTELSLLQNIDDDIRENLLVVKDSADHLLDLINAILDISKIEAGKIELEVIDFDIFELIQSVLNIFTAQIEKNNLFLKFEKDEKIQQYVKGDPVKIKQILVNLIGNAVKFTHKGGVIVKLTGAEQLNHKIELTISVSDSGIGIPEDKLMSIFDSFSQVDLSTSRKYGGTGLGLSISKQMVELMGGSIHAESKLEKGTTFYLTIFVDHGNEEVINEKILLSKDIACKQLEMDNSSKNILVVDDNLSNIKVAENFLTQFGYTTFVATNAKEAFQIISCINNLGIILMDIEMPEMDGLEATKLIRNGKIKNSNANIPIVAMTAHPLSSYQHKCIEAGMNDFVNKPIDFHELKIVIERVLSTRSDHYFQKAAQKKSQKEKLKVLNTKKAMYRLNGDEELYNFLLSEFKTTIHSRIKEIRKAIEIKDYKQIQSCSHSLKTVSGNIGAEYIFNICQSLEINAKSEHNDHLEELFNKLQKELKKLEMLYPQNWV